MSKKVKPLSVMTKIVHQEFHDCDAPGCPNIVSTQGKPYGYSGPFYCRLHVHLSEK